MARCNHDWFAVQPGQVHGPAAGRFISEDPIGTAGGSANQYAYAVNAPTLWADPLGLFPSERTALIALDLLIFLFAGLAFIAAPPLGVAVLPEFVMYSQLVAWLGYLGAGYALVREPVDDKAFGLAITASTLALTLAISAPVIASTAVLVLVSLQLIRDSVKTDG